MGRSEVLPPGKLKFSMVRISERTNGPNLPLIFLSIFYGNKGLTKIIKFDSDPLGRLIVVKENISCVVFVP